MKAVAGAALAGDLERRLEPGAPGGAVEAGAQAQGDAAAVGDRHVADDAGHREAHAGVEGDGCACCARGGPATASLPSPGTWSVCRRTDGVRSQAAAAPLARGATQTATSSATSATKRRREGAREARVPNRERACHVAAGLPLVVVSHAPGTRRAGRPGGGDGSRPCFYGVGRAPRFLEQEVSLGRLVGLPRDL